MEISVLCIIAVGQQDNTTTRAINKMNSGTYRMQLFEIVQITFINAVYTNARCMKFASHSVLFYDLFWLLNYR